MNEIIGNATHEQLYPTISASLEWADASDWMYTKWVAARNGIKFAIREASKIEYVLSAQGDDDHLEIHKYSSLAEAKAHAETINVVAEEPRNWMPRDAGDHVDVMSQYDREPTPRFVSPRMEDNEPSFF